MTRNLTRRPEGSADDAALSRPHGATRSLKGPLLAGGAVLAATALVALVDPGVEGRYPPCPFLAVTGWACPLCGGLRAVHELTRLDLPAALSYHPLVPPLLVLAAAFWVSWVVRAARGRSADVPLTRWTYRVILTGGAVFAVVRNLPGMEPLLPG